jgi:hypothetical protein
MAPLYIWLVAKESSEQCTEAMQRENLCTLAPKTKTKTKTYNA